MRYPSHDPECGICLANAEQEKIFANELWTVRRLPSGIGVPGWVMVSAQRHVAEIADFDAREAADFGPAMRHFCRVLREVTGALRIYTAALGESFPHFHAHLVPRYQRMPGGVKAWSVFDLYRATSAGEVAIDENEAARMAEAYQRALQRDPPE